MTSALLLPRQTRTGLLPEARHVILPEGIASTGWPAVRNVCRRMGLRHDRWQDDLNTAILAKDSEGWYAADTVVISICRQAGKTWDVGSIVFADSIISPGTTTVWTAHRFKVARETFSELSELAKTDALAPYIDYRKITTGAGSECIPFRNGSRIVFGARERGTIRGFSKVRRLVLDEAQMLSDSVMSDLAPTMNHAFNPQIIMMGTPPKPTDNGETFTEFRENALAGRSEGVLYVEFSADPDSDPDDWAAVEQANPSYPKRTTRRAIVRLRKLLPDDEDYRREGLGIWEAAGVQSVIPKVDWDKQGDGESLAVARLAVGVEVAPDLKWAAISLAGQRPDGDWHVELEERRDGASWVENYLVNMLAANPDIYRKPVVDVGGPIEALLHKGRHWRFKNSGMMVRPVRVAELGAGCSLLYDGVTRKRDVWHTRQPQMNAAVKMAGKRKLGDTGMWVFSRSNTTADITPVQSAVLALVGAQDVKTRRQSNGRRRTGGRKAVVLSG